ncbi:MAG: hypothetical protein ACOWWM_03035 [Desulfobacterales bacterium]
MKRFNRRRTGLIFLVAFAGMALAFAAPAGAALQAVGPVSGPHGFPLYYTDTDNLSLELCLDEGWCFFDPVDPNDPEQVALGVGGEVFWWMAESEIAADGMDASLTLALEGTFGGDESVVNGQQISFGRLRIRVDVPADGNYLVTHPFGSIIFQNVTIAEGINYTADIGAANFLNPVEGFLGALQSDIGPFLTWPDYQNDPALLSNGVQYVGDNATPHVVVGSPIANAEHSSGFQNFFRVEGPGGILAETDLFVVMGRVYDGKAPLAHVYPPPPTETNLQAVGPVNRLIDFGEDGTATATFVDDGTTLGYPLGYPIWYQDYNALQLTICQGGTVDDPNPLCISDPIDPNDPNQTALYTGGETFWWSADAFIDEDSPLDDPTFEGTLPPPGVDEDDDEVVFDASLILGLEGTFGGDESLIDGQQISFGRTRIRIDTTFEGEYTVIYPYGQKTFNVPAGQRAINFTADLGIADPADPDSAFVGSLYSEIGPHFLTWNTFNADPNLNDVALFREQPALDPDGNPILDELGNPITHEVHYVGDPGILHEVTGSPFIDEEGNAVNYFRVIGVDPVNPANNFDVRTYLFAVSGQVFDPVTFRGGITTGDQNTAPVVTAPAPVTLTAPLGETTVPATDPAIAAFLAGATATDAEDGTLLVTHDAPADFPLGTTTVTFSATDSGGLTGTATSTVTINAEGQNIAPVVTAPAPVTVTAPLGETTVPATDPAIAAFLAGATADDVEDGPLSVTHDAPAEFPVGTTTVTFSATDSGGLTGTATSTVTVNAAVQNTAPVVTAPAPVTVTAQLGETTVPAGDVVIAAFLTGATADDVEDGPLSVTHDAPAEFPVGTTTVTFSATDSGGLTGTATSTVTVTEAQAAVLSIQQFKATNQVRIGRNQSVDFTLRVRNRDRTLTGLAAATVVGVQNGETIYSFTTGEQTVPGRETVVFAIPAFTPTALGNITWTVTVMDVTATATTRVRQ